MKASIFSFLLIFSSFSYAQTRQDSEKIQQDAKAGIIAAGSTATVISFRNSTKNLGKMMKASDILERHLANAKVYKQLDYLDHLVPNSEIQIVYEVMEDGVLKTKNFSYPHKFGAWVPALEKVEKLGGKTIGFKVLSRDIVKNVTKHTVWSFVDLALAAGFGAVTVKELGESTFSKQIAKNSAARLNSDRSTTSGVDKTSDDKEAKSKNSRSVLKQ